MSLLSKISQIGFEILRATDAIVGLPKKLANTLQFRRSWKQFIKNSASSPTLWIHGASLGELEDLASFFLNPEALKESGYSASRLIITSSSISAMDFLVKIQKENSILYAGPIPLENSKQIKDFLNTFQPELLILSHSDLWPLLLERAQSRFLKKGIIWLPAKSSAAQNLFEKVITPQKLIAIGLRREDDRKEIEYRTQKYPHTKVTLIGNARLERIQSRIQNQKNKDQLILESYRATPDRSKVSIMLGSAWPEDAAILGDALKNLKAHEQDRFQIIVLPHVSNDMHLIASIQHLLPSSRVIAQQGILLEAYQNFDLAFVGGGFRSGLHNVLEPILWNLPVICGPKLKQQPEAPWLEELGALFPIHSTDSLVNYLRGSLIFEEFSKRRQNAILASSNLCKSMGASKRLSLLLSEINVSEKIERHI